MLNSGDFFSRGPGARFEAAETGFDLDVSMSQLCPLFHCHVILRD